MQRRRLIRQGAAWSAAALGVAGLPACSGAGDDSPRFARIGDAVRAIEAAVLNQSRTAQGWTLPEVLNHVAQGIEYSIGAGFPVLNSSLFRHTVGGVAFRVFDARGAMSHSLTEPIPGAPPLDEPSSLAGAAQRCTKALLQLQAHTGAVQPHFAYGELTREQNQRAHLMHLANHWTLLALKA